MTLAACADLVKRADPDKFRAVQAAREDFQEKLIPLYAFNIEISRAPWVTAEPMIAEMRLQWWRDVVEEIAQAKPVRAHEVAQPLSEVVRAHNIPTTILDQMVTARRWDIYSDSFEDKRHFNDYIDHTMGHLMWASAIALGAKAALEDDIRSFAYGAGVAALLQAARVLEMRGRKPLLDGRPEGIKMLCAQALERLSSCPHVTASTAPALWPGWQAKSLLKLALKEPGRVADGTLYLSEFSRNWELLRRQVFNKF